MTTDDEAQLVGTITEFGTKTKDEVATETTAVDGIDQISVVGKLSGTLVYSTIATDGDEAETTT
jgi:hypothetical protein